MLFCRQFYGIKWKTTRELSLDLITSQSIICRHLKKIEKLSKLGVWLLHTVSEKNKEGCISRATNLSQPRNYHFHKNIITDYEKWVFYHNIQHKRQGINKYKSPQVTKKSWASWLKSYAVWMVGTSRYYSFWVFKLQSDAQCRLILSTAATRAWKSFKKTHCTRRERKRCASLWQAQIL